MKRLIGLFAKEPRPGFVKTRLAAATSPPWAAEVANAFLNDLVQKLLAVDAERAIVYAPRSGLDFFSRIAPAGFKFVEQAEGDLGQRMKRFCRSALDDDNQAIVLVGMDSPTMPTRYIEKAFDMLANADVVVGPATDGGYYLLGIARKVPPIFDNIEWGSAKVLLQTVAQLPQPAWRIGVLQPWYDIDTLDDVFALGGHISACRSAGIDLQIPITEHLLARGIPASE